MLQNDQVDGNDGNDTIIGDNGVIVIPVVSSQQFQRDAFNPLEVSKSIEKATDKALKDLEKERDRELKDHIRNDHDDLHIGSDGDSDGNNDDYNNVKPRQFKQKDLKLIPFEFEFDIQVGKDELSGGVGEDLIIGDLGELVWPVGMETPTKKNEAKELNNAIRSLLKDVEHLFRDEQPGGHMEHRYFKLGGSDGSDGGSDGGSDQGVANESYNDVIDGGAGNDVIFGDSARVQPIFEKKVPVKQLNFAASPIDGNSDGNSDGNGDRGGNDYITAGDGDDVVFGQEGNDIIWGDDGNDLLRGGSGRDTIQGGNGRDQLFGGSEHDKLNGGPGKDRVRQGSDGDSDGSDDVDVNLDNPWLQLLGYNTLNAIDELNPNTDIWLTFGHGSDGDSDGGSD